MLRGVAGKDVTLVRVKLYLMECMAILGRREEPTDGVHDYCCYLRDALAKEGVNLSLRQVRWAEIGQKASRRELLEGVKGKKKFLFSSAIHGVVVVAPGICAASGQHSEIIKKKWSTMRRCISRSRWLHRK